MAETPNHEYNVPDQGQQDWHVPLNENFEAFEVDIELRDQEGNLGNYTPAEGAKFLATDTGVVYVGNGTDWVPQFVFASYDPSADEATITPTLVASEFDVGTISGSLTGGTPLSTIAGNNLSIDSNGQLNASTGGGGGGGNWTKNNNLLEPSDNSIDGIDVDEVDTSLVTAAGSGPLTLTVDGNQSILLDVDGNFVAGNASNDVLDGAIGTTIAGGAGSSNVVNDNHGTISGGSNNVAGSSGGDPNARAFATVGGGEGNQASSKYSTISGGVSNRTLSEGATVGGGDDNEASGEKATIAGGQINEASGFTAAIGGGQNHDATGSTSTISGGRVNKATAEDATVGGGWSNEATERASTVGGGTANLARGQFSTIAGGGPSDLNNISITQNVVHDDYGTIGGGSGNRVGQDSGGTAANGSTIGGGQGNAIDGPLSTIAGGNENVINAEEAVIGGGEGNAATGYYATVGGGSKNEATAQGATVAGGGGASSSTGNTASGLYSTVAGGTDNGAGGDGSFLGGGTENTVSGTGGTLGGGVSNSVFGDQATVPGGQQNSASGNYSFAAGRKATASDPGSFVVGDSTSTEATSFRADEARFQIDLRTSLLKTESSVFYVPDENSAGADWRTTYDTGNDRWMVDRWNPNVGTVGSFVNKMWVTSSGDIKAEGSKDFVETVDTEDGEKEVHYTATESGTPHTEVSGVAELDDGRVEVELPEHFEMVTSDDEPLVVDTTPYSTDSSGLAAVERSTDRLVVEDLDGDGDYEFAYTVKGTRDGYEDKQVVREPSQTTATTQSPEPADD
jgi:hypothetical protein